MYLSYVNRRRNMSLSMATASVSIRLRYFTGFSWKTYAGGDKTALHALAAIIVSSLRHFAPLPGRRRPAPLADGADAEVWI